MPTAELLRLVDERLPCLTTLTPHEAAIMAARSYEKLGKNDEAVKILNDIVDEGGPQKHAAKKMLRRLRNEEDADTLK